jgi:hypothetical protein
LLSPTKLKEALYQSEISGLPTGERFMEGDQAYNMSFWGHPYQTYEGRYFQVPYMQGHGGNSVVLAPNGVTGFRFTDAHNYDVGPLTQVIETIHPFPDGWLDPVWLYPEAFETYSQYSFSLEHPASMVAIESGLWFQGEVSNQSGWIQFRYQPNSPEILGVLWDHADSPPDLEAFLEQFVTVIEGLGADIERSGPLDTMDKGSHKTLVQQAVVSEGEYQYMATAGVWYCNEANRIYLLYYSAIPEYTAQDDTLRMFLRYIDSFSCHE